MEHETFISYFQKKLTFFYLFFCLLEIMLIFGLSIFKNLTTMANKRKLKRTISSICEELMGEALAASIYAKNVNKGDVDNILSSLLIIHSNSIRRVSHPEPGMRPKAYYKDLINNFNADVSEIIDHITTI